jgi:hypothetical protein
VNWTATSSLPASQIFTIPMSWLFGPRIRFYYH